MADWLWLIPVFPLAAALLLTLVGRRLPKPAIAAVAVGAVAAAALAAALAAGTMGEGGLTQSLWRWLAAVGFESGLVLHFDGLAAVMTLTVATVGLLVLLYSAAYMAGEEGYSRFFAQMTLFVGAMLALVLADDLLLLFIGWEAVGLCSFLLIGFRHRDAANGAAARKAFVVTRTADVAMVVALLWLGASFGGFGLPRIEQGAAGAWSAGSPEAVAVAALLLVAAVGKSAQLPLHVWLPDAMAGPTPVSALLHAATMVIAGVYLIARLHFLFELAPVVQAVAAALGAATLLAAAVSAFFQTDIKRLLAFSTISQIGYMFVALGVGAWSAALFHFLTHAAFKSLLFLAAGVMIQDANTHEFARMGPMRSARPLAFWSYTAGAASLAAVPLVTAGYYSKEHILGALWDEAPVLWLCAWLGAVVTAMYAFRPVFVLGRGTSAVRAAASPWPVATTLSVLAVLALAGGWAARPLSAALDPVFTTAALSHVAAESSAAAWAATALGVYIAWRAARGYRVLPVDRRFVRAARAGWGFDAAYGRIAVALYRWVVSVLATEPADRLFMPLASAATASHRRLSSTQSGRLRRYAVAMMLGVVLAAGAAVFL